jgi:hypothetical protein
MKKYVPYIVVFLLGLLIGYLPKGRLQRETIVEKRDTLVLKDTHIVYQPKEVVREKWKTEMVVVTDTIRMRDTLYMSLPLEKKTYRRDEFYAEVTGYNPSLTYIEVFPKTVYVTETTRKKDKANYLSAGVDVLYLGTVYVPIYVEYERMLHRNFSVYARGMGDIWTGTKGLSVGVRAKIGW